MSGAETIPPDLLEETIAVLARRFGVSDWECVPTRHVARKSAIHALRSRKERHAVALKIYRGSAARNGVMNVQAAALRRFQPALAANNDGFDMPEVYGFFPQAKAIAMEWIDAQPLEQVLVRAALDLRSHNAAIARAAAWLRRFHHASGVSRQSFDPLRYLVLLDRRMKSHPDAAALLERDPLWEQGRRRLLDNIPRLVGEDVAVATAHGDFTSTNVLIARDRVVSVDVWGHRIAPVADDLARMFVYLAMGDPLPLRARFGPVAPEGRRSMQALLAGYEGADWPQAAVFEHVLLFESLARWLSLTSRLNRRYRFNERWKCNGARRLVQSLVACPTA